MGTLETRKVGSLEVSVAGLGCNNFGMRIDEDASKTVVDAALDAGVNHFDTADIYGGGKSEEFLGHALGSRRDDAIITTKVGMGVPEGSRGGSREYVLSRCDASLQRLGTDRIDLYLLHTPDVETPIGETLEAFGELIHAGKVREIGCSNFSAAQLDEAAHVARELGVPGFVNAQNDYSLLNRDVEAEVLPAVDRLAMTFMPYFPLASGVLTGKYKRGEDHPEGSRLAAWGNMAGEFRVRRAHGGRRGARRVRAGARSHAARACVVVAGGQPGRRQRDRRRHEARADPRQRRGHGRVAAHARGARRDRRHRARRGLAGPT